MEEKSRSIYLTHFAYLQAIFLRQDFSKNFHSVQLIYISVHFTESVNQMTSYVYSILQKINELQRTNWKF